MKKIILIFGMLSFTFINVIAQSIYLGLENGMSKSQANKEFKENKEKYTDGDIGNGFAWRLYKQNFIYNNSGLVEVLFSPVGGGLGMSYDNTINYLNYTRKFFDTKGYKTIYEPEYWNAPENFVEKSYKYGLLMGNKEKTIIVQLYPKKIQNLYNAYFKVLNYEWFNKIFEKDKIEIKEAQDKTGF